MTAFHNYLLEIQCPLINDQSSFNPARKGEYITWLVGHAFALDYEEQGSTYNQDATTYTTEHISDNSTVSSSSSSSSNLSPETIKLLHELATLLHVSIDKKSPSELLQGIHRVLRMWILPATTEKEEQKHTSSSSSSSNTKSSTNTVTKTKTNTNNNNNLNMQEFTAGFSTGNDTLDKASTILRMLYIADLRELQDAVNDIIVTVQDYVADPRTDASLGMVGR